MKSHFMRRGRIMRIVTYEVGGLWPAIEGMRNPMKSWDKSDSYEVECDHNFQCGYCGAGDAGSCECQIAQLTGYLVGPDDLKLMKRLANTGPDHGKFMRQIVVWADITAPRYWWSEFDTYRIGVEKQSESTMHTIMKDELGIDSFQDGTPLDVIATFVIKAKEIKADETLSEAKKIRKIKMCLPEGFLQQRTVMMSYAALRNIYHQRKNHRLPEWHVFCDWIASLPYSELITGEPE